jgi:hypothetical protein
MAELLKEAIADAKAVREVALQNAKMALEEAFDSKLKNMLSAKLAEELEEDVELEEVYEEDDTDVTSEGDNTYEEDDVTEEFDLEEDLDEEINLDELMAELASLEEGDDEDEVKEEKDEETTDEGIGAKVAGTVKGIGKAFNMFTTPDETAADLRKTLAANPELKNDEKFMAMLKALEAFAGAAAGAGAARRAEGVEESFDIDALISEIEADLEEGKKKAKDDEKKEDEEKKKIKEELAEALSTVETLKSTISEMNLLNSKLLYCNKLFRANSLTEAQKIKVVDALDKAATTGEAKLVFETLEESFAFTGVEKRAIQEGLGRASKAAGTAPQKVITESVDETVSRFQKLANINK